MDELWELLESDDIEIIFNTSVAYFKQDLVSVDDGYEDDDYTDYIIELVELLEANNAFEDLIEFRNIIKNYNPNVYHKCFGYLDCNLVSYFCFKNDKHKIEESLKGFLEHPTEFFDIYNTIFEKLILYKQTDILQNIIEKNFDDISNSEKFCFDPEYQMASCYKNFMLEDIFEKNTFDRNNFVNTLKSYNYKFEDLFLDINEEILTNQSSNIKISHDNVMDEIYYNVLKVELGFQKYMHSKGLPFYLSGWIFENFRKFWHTKRKGKNYHEFYYEIEPKKFEEFIGEISTSMMLDLNHVNYGLLWGGIYVYDFLFNNNLVSEQYYNSIIIKIKQLKGQSIAFDLDTLWHYDFVHGWEKPDSISTNEFKHEQRIFEKSMFIKNEEFHAQVKHIEDDLDQIGELSNYIIKSGEGRLDYYDNILNSLQESMVLKEDNYATNINTYNEPLRTEKKVGRNEPCPCGSGKKYKKCCL